MTKSKIDSSPLNVHVIFGLKLQATDLLLITSVQLFEPQSESRTNFLHVHSLVALSKDVAMMSKEDEISLVMKSNNPSPSKFWLLGEQGGQKSAYSDSHPRVEVVQDQLRHMFSRHCMVLYLLLIFNVCDFKDCQQSFEMPNQHLPPLAEPDHNYMGKIQIFSVLVDLLQLHAPPRIVSHIVEHHHQFSQKIVDLFGWFQLSRQQYLHRPILLQNVVKLIYKGLILVISFKLLSSFLLVFNRHRLLPFLSWQLFPLFPLLHLYLILHNPSLVMYFHSFLLVFYLVRLFLIGGLELLHCLGLWFHFWLLLRLRLVRVSSCDCLFDHCWN